MLNVTFALGFLLAILVAESSSQRFIQPTYKPPRRFPKPNIRVFRGANQVTASVENVPVAPTDELESLHRNVRSLDSPSAKRGGSHSTSSGSRDTGATHPGYNRRNAREIRLPGHLNPLRPKPLYPRPTFPAPVPRIPIYARTVRDIQYPGIRKPTHRDVIIPNWNPHVKTSPWDSLGGKRRHQRSIDFNKEVLNEVEFMDFPHDRMQRDIQIGGLPKKQTHRDVIIPNWNPHVKTNPWNRLGGRQRHGRSIEFAEEVINDADFDGQLHERVARDIQIDGLPRKPTHRDVIIPNWNPHVKTNPWDSLGGRGRHGRSIEFTEDINDVDEEA